MNTRLTPLTAALLLTGAFPLSAQAITAPVIADAHLAPGNVGSSPTISIGPAAKGLLRFDLSALPINTLPSDITRATLVFFTKSVPATGQLRIRAIDAATPWSEATATAATPLAFTGTPATSGTIAKANTYYLVDVTTLAQSAFNPAGATLELALDPAPDTPTAALSFDSKESIQTSHPAYLDIQLAGSAVNFTGALSGDITGSQGATVVTQVGGSSAANIHAAEQAVTAATATNTPHTLVKRDASGSFAAETGSFISLKVLGGSPTLGRVLTSDADGTASWQLPASNGWSLIGNASDASQFIGTTDNLNPLAIKVNNEAALRFTHDGVAGDPPNLIGGHAGNTVTSGAKGAVIGGGGLLVGSNNATNLVTDDFGTVGGGLHNRAGDHGGTTTDSTYSTVAGGTDNTASGRASTVAGGADNTASGFLSTVPGGSNNIASGFGSFAAGQQARAEHQAAFVWADGSGDPFASTADHEFSVRASGGVRLVTPSLNLPTAGNPGAGKVLTSDAAGKGTWQAPASGIASVTASAPLSVANGTTAPAISLGTVPVANGGTGATSLTGYLVGTGTGPVTASATIPATDIGGTLTDAQVADSLTLGGGSIDATPIGGTTPAAGAFTTLKVTGGDPAAGKVLTSDASGNATWQPAADGWGLAGNASGPAAFIGTTDNSHPLVIKVNNESALRFAHDGVAGDAPNLVGGYSGNNAPPAVRGAFIGGGGLAGLANLVTDDFGAVGGGSGNRAGDNGGTTTDRNHATVAGGFGNTASDTMSTVGGGYHNTADGTYSVVAGGDTNTASGAASMVAGGTQNTASGTWSFAAGQQAQAQHDGAFVWADGSGGPFASTAANEFSVRASGGVRLVTPSLSLPGTGTPGAGKVLTSDAAGNGTWQAPATGIASVTASAPLTVANGTTAPALGLGTVPVANGGTGATSLTGYLVGTGTGPVLARDTIPAADIFGTLSDTQIANNLTLFGGLIDGTPIGSFTPAAGSFSSLRLISGFPGAGQVLTSDASGNATWQAAGGWSLTGNASGPAAFIGTTDNAHPLTVKVNNEPVLRFTHDGVAGDAPNLIGGHAGNTVAAGVKGAVVGGGGLSNVFNLVTDDFGAVGGGSGNRAGDNGGTTTDRNHATVAGGLGNTASGATSTVGGGHHNTASGMRSFAAGRQAQAQHSSAFVWADNAGEWFASTAANEFSVRASGGVRLVTPFLSLPNAGTPGAGRVLTSDASGNGTWQANSAWSLAGNASNAAQFIGTTDNLNPLVVKVNNEPVLRFTHDGVAGDAPNLIGGHAGNTVVAGVKGAVVGGGGRSDSINRITDDFGTVGGGSGNRAGDNGGTTADRNNATVAGGADNTASGRESTVAGGYHNTASGDKSTVAGGVINTASGINSVVVGGVNNAASGDTSVVAGGSNNTASGNSSIVAGGSSNTASGVWSFAAGFQAQAQHNGAFVWADTDDIAFSSTAANEFSVRATGGVRLVTAIDGISGIPTAGVQLSAGSGTWTSLSDRNAKENLAPVDGRQVLEKVAALPMQTWNYKTQADDIRHIGPMAQDFRAAFQLGENDKTIATVDADGVALAAIQGLYKLVEEQRKLAEEQRRLIQSQRDEIAAMRRENQRVAERLQRVEAQFLYTAR
ncbi:tail fiber domain-containing protein [Methylomagnum sp.]